MPRGHSTKTASALVSFVEGALGGVPLHHPPESVATLWAGYGKILRYHTRESAPRSVILKQIRFPRAGGADRGHQRKVRSYEVEKTFYERFAQLSRERARVPVLLAAARRDDEFWLLLEDIDAAGYPSRPRAGRSEVTRAGLEWLAAFHAAHLGRKPHGLWEEGSYWYLSTRPDEHNAIKGHPLHALAPELDRRLRRARHRTLVHGDPKLENFCAQGGPHPRFAAVDFQYVGGGVGVRDVVYFIGSAVEPARVEAELPRLLDDYFRALHQEHRAQGGTSRELEEVEAEWRELVPVAWLDFYRFTLGWSSAWAQSDVYAQKLLRELAL